MLKLLTKTSVSTAIAAAIALGSSQAFATLTFDLSITGVNGVSTGGVSSVSANAGDTINLTLYYTINGTSPGMYDWGGSFTSTGSGGPTAGYLTAPVLGTGFTAAGSQVGTVFDANHLTWGDTTNPDDAAAFVYGRSNADGATGVPTPVLGTGNVALATISYVVSSTPLSSFVLSFSPRDRAGVADQLWQENGVSTDDTLQALGATIGATINTGVVVSASSWIATTAGSSWDTAGNWSPATTPNSATASAVFGSSATSTTAVSNAIGHTVNNITFNGNGNNDAGKGAGNYVISGAGTITLAGTSPTITVNSGTQIITAPIDITAAGLTKAGAGTLAVNNLRTTSTVSINGGILQINPAGGAAGASKVGGLSFSGGGKLDLNNDSIVISGSTLPAVVAEIAAGQIFTSNTATNTGLGIALGSDPNIVADLGGTMEGQSYGPTDVLIRYTYLGDANLDGQTNFSDLGYVLANYGKPGPFSWTQGDFNGDGLVGFGDLGFLLATYNKPQILSDGVISLSPTFGSAVPEPTSLALLGLGAVALVSRKRRAAKQ